MTGDHNGDYGIDGSFHTVSARGQAIGVSAASAGLALTAGISLARGRGLTAALTGAASVGIAASAALYIYATKAGKFEVWNRILDDLQLHGDETLLGMGCGRGAVLLAAAKRLPRGHAIGVDLWQADQTDNSPSATLTNAKLENVADRIELHTADMTALPFEDNSFDAIVSSLAIHNIPGHDGRRRALNEAMRVLKPSGRLAIADLWETRQHAEHLQERGWQHVQRRSVGWRMWYGGPWMSTHLITAAKPVST
ncbi:class I SAM-dependent methyltransferase [Candidatus Mycobacterium methanotrophicum]|uniref:Class I SAM-dependent methyltransferase n=1 Tax=Candidatus Mycobacterium methanotrophicum TaxID=2943498 RepID=A0ABY4QMH1_9MYCO|nr:class I SAM-dependent methyltransferase [Candidatus Mycobacterium methanotrophicum]UQX11146.1 class I SAM-dependent methyltransferase [Candidatus Mycobacterium methanotrophicum]